MSDYQPLRIGIIGLGSMGTTHLNAYSLLEDATVVAVSDRNYAKRLSEPQRGGNIEGQGRGRVDKLGPEVQVFDDGQTLIDEADVNVVDICVQTPGHLTLGLASLEAGKHTLIEKPLARTAEDARKLASAADAAWAQHRAVSMCALCMRFWPGWDWLRQAVVDGRYGKVRAASFTRVASHPGGKFFLDGEASGGAALDLHLHDIDFIRWCFATDVEVENIDAHTSGYEMKTGRLDHVLTRIALPSNTDGVADDALFFAEGSWAMADGFPFTMRYVVNFDRATVDFDLARSDAPLHVYEEGQTSTPPLPEGLGYGHQIAYFIDCIRGERPADRVTFSDAAASIELLEKALQAGGHRC